MGHVVFIHGLANKPKVETLTTQWLSALTRADRSGLDLERIPATSEMCYWADVLYAAPSRTSEDEEDDAAARGPDRDPGPSREWQAGLPAEQQRFVDGLRAKLEQSAAKVRADAAAAAAAGDRFFPLPRPLERRIMERLLKDAHHYLYDGEFEPRAGERFKVKAELRRRFIDALKRGKEKPGPLIVVSHSMGTMIAYDCLRHVPETPPVDALITLGSPLGISEVQDGWGDTWKKKDAFPGERVPRDKWLNFSDRLDLVCAAAPKLASDYQLGGAEVVQDARVRNSGSWRHYIAEYLARDQIRDALKTLLVPA